MTADVCCGLAGAGSDVPGAGSDVPRAGMRSWAVGRNSRAHVYSLALTENLADILGQYLLPVFHGNPGLHSKGSFSSSYMT